MGSQRSSDGMIVTLVNGCHDGLQELVLCSRLRVSLRQSRAALSNE